MGQWYRNRFRRGSGRQEANRVTIDNRIHNHALGQYCIVGDWVKDASLSDVGINKPHAQEVLGDDHSILKHGGLDVGTDDL